MARRELEWSGTAAEPNRKCANLSMCVDSWDTPVQMCLPQWGFQSALLQWSQTFLLDSIRGTLESVHLEVMAEVFLREELCSFSCQQLSYHSQCFTEVYMGAIQYNNTLSLLATGATDSYSFCPKAAWLQWLREESACSLFPNHLQAHHSNLKDLQSFFTKNSSYFLKWKQPLPWVQSATISYM